MKNHFHSFARQFSDSAMHNASLFSVFLPFFYALTIKKEEPDLSDSPEFLLCTEYTVTGITDTGNDVVILIKSLIHNACVDLNVRMCLSDCIYAFR